MQPELGAASLRQGWGWRLGGPFQPNHAECVMYVPIFCYGADTNRICSLNLLAATVKQHVPL